MSGLLEILRAAIPGAAAARVGYNQGQANRQAIDAVAAKQAKAEQRQTLLDKMKAEIDAANLDQTRAETEKLRRPPAAPEEDWRDVANADTPTLYEAHSGRTKPLEGVTRPKKPVAPVRGTPEYEAALEREAAIAARHRQPRAPAATTGKTPTERHLDRVERQVADNRRDLAAEDNLASPDSGRMAKIRARGDSLGKVRDSLAGEVGGVSTTAGKSAVVPKLTPISASDDDVREIVRQISSGAVPWTAGTVDSAAGLSPAQKATIKAAIAARKPSGGR